MNDMNQMNYLNSKLNDMQNEILQLRNENNYLIKSINSNKDFLQAYSLNISNNSSYLNTQNKYAPFTQENLFNSTQRFQDKEGNNSQFGSFEVPSKAQTSRNENQSFPNKEHKEFNKYKRSSRDLNINSSNTSPTKVYKRNKAKTQSDILDSKNKSTLNEIMNILGVQKQNSLINDIKKLKKSYIDSQEALKRLSNHEKLILNLLGLYSNLYNENISIQSSGISNQEIKLLWRWIKSMVMKLKENADDVYNLRNENEYHKQEILKYQEIIAKVESERFRIEESYLKLKENLEYYKNQANLADKELEVNKQHSKELDLRIEEYSKYKEFCDTLKTKLNQENFDSLVNQLDYIKIQKQEDNKKPFIIEDNPNEATKITNNDISFKEKDLGKEEIIRSSCNRKESMKSDNETPMPRIMNTVEKH